MWLLNIILLMALIVTTVLTPDRLTATIIALSSIPIFYLSAISPLQVRISIGETLLIKTPPYAKKEVTFQEIQELKKISLAKDKSYKPIYRKFGVGLLKYRVGKFAIRNKRNAIFATNKDDAVLIVLEDVDIIVSPEKSNDFFNLLQEKIKQS
ncbi:MAG: PH domain-containing protein [bacterium]